MLLLLLLLFAALSRLPSAVLPPMDARPGPPADGRPRPRPRRSAAAATAALVAVEGPRAKTLPSRRSASRLRLLRLLLLCLFPSLVRVLDHWCCHLHWPCCARRRTTRCPASRPPRRSGRSCCRPSCPGPYCCCSHCRLCCCHCWRRSSGCHSRCARSQRRATSARRAARARARGSGSVRRRRLPLCRVCAESCCHC